MTEENRLPVSEDSWCRSVNPKARATSDIMLGAIDTGAILFLVFTVRAEDSIRLISARAATGGERLIYEETK
jgi:uncharacterized DUF497 family protein